MENEILEELWETRRKMEKEYGNDLRKMFVSIKGKMPVPRKGKRGKQRIIKSRSGSR